MSFNAQGLNRLPDLLTDAVDAGATAFTLFDRITIPAGGAIRFYHRGGYKHEGVFSSQRFDFSWLRGGNVESAKKNRRADCNKTLNATGNAGGKIAVGRLFTRRGTKHKRVSTISTTEWFYHSRQ